MSGDNRRGSSPFVRPYAVTGGRTTARPTSRLRRSSAPPCAPGRTVYASSPSSAPRRLRMDLQVGGRESALLTCRSVSPASRRATWPRAVRQRPAAGPVRRAAGRHAAGEGARRRCAACSPAPRRFRPVDPAGRGRAGLRSAMPTTRQLAVSFGEAARTTTASGRGRRRRRSTGCCPRLRSRARFWGPAPAADHAGSPTRRGRRGGRARTPGCARCWSAGAPEVDRARRGRRTDPVARRPGGAARMSAAWHWTDLAARGPGYRPGAQPGGALGVPLRPPGTAGGPVDRRHCTPFVHEDAVGHGDDEPST